MDALYAALIAPFADYAFMLRALIGTIALSISAAPIGVLLVARRMSLVGDTMSHAILPGVAIGFLIFGFSVTALTAAGFLAGLLVALGAGFASRVTPLKEDAAFASLYLISLSAGVLILSVNGTNIDLLHILFGTVLSLNNTALVLTGLVATATILAFALFYRPILAESFDPGFLRPFGWSSPAYAVFVVLLAINLVGAFHALGTLMAVGLLILPASTARFFADTFDGQVLWAALTASAATLVGLLVSFHFDAPAGPAIILSAGLLHIAAILFGPRDGQIQRLFSHHHLQG
ncbi:MAG: metal ABC transporter permease [Alphaproteobacteria bacterium]|nr:metal ABC transporter permease [Alphaproteobacteria bacterium]